MLKSKLIVLTIFASFSFATANAAEIIYKWKDANGNVKYTQSKPPAGIDYIKIRNKGASTKATKVEKEQAEDSVSGELDGVIADQNKEMNRVDKVNAQRAAKNCTIAKNNLEALTGNNRIQVEENGKLRLLNDDEKSKRLDTAKANVTKYCK